MIPPYTVSLAYLGIAQQQALRSNFWKSLRRSCFIFIHSGRSAEVNRPGAKVKRN